MVKRKSDLKSDHDEKMDLGASAEGTKPLLIHAAKRLFAKKGYDATTVKDISDEAGVNVSLVSYHYGGKEGLYRACLQQMGVERLSTAQRVLQPPSSFEELRVRLTMFVEEMFGWMLGEPECCKIIQREADSGLPVAGDVFEATFLQVHETIRQFFAKAQKSGLVSSELDPPVVSALFFGSILHIIRSDDLNQRFYGKTLRDSAYQKKVKEQFLNIFLKGLTDTSHTGAESSR